MKKRIFKILTLSAAVALITGCGTASSRALQTPSVASAGTHYSGAKVAVSIGRFNNQSSYQNGIFSDGEDRLGNQASTIVVSSLQESGRFSVLERTNMKILKEESALSKTAQNLKGANYRRSRAIRYSRQR